MFYSKSGFYETNIMARLEGPVLALFKIFLASSTLLKKKRGRSQLT